MSSKNGEPLHSRLLQYCSPAESAGSGLCQLNFCRVMNIESARHEQSFRHGIDRFDALEINQHLPTFNPDVTIAQNLDISDKLLAFREHVDSSKAVPFGPRSLQQEEIDTGVPNSLQNVRIQRRPQLQTTRKVPCTYWIATEPDTVEKGFAEVVLVSNLRLALDRADTSLTATGMYRVAY